MKWIKFIALFFSAAAFTLLDTSFFANLSVGHATIISTFQLIIIFALISDTKNYFIFMTSTIIFFSIFSSLPMWVIFSLFFLLPSVILYLRKVHLPLPSVPITLILFAIANLFFESILLFYAREWNRSGFSVLCYFIIINTIFGTVSYYVVHSFLNFRAGRGKINNF